MRYKSAYALYFEVDRETYKRSITIDAYDKQVSSASN